MKKKMRNVGKDVVHHLVKDQELDNFHPLLFHLLK
jgi:hypothetical protein